MKAVILNGGKKDDATGVTIHGLVCDSLKEQGWEVSSLPLAEMKIHACIGCFNCWFKTPGECSFKDDGQTVAKEIAQCDALIFLSQVTFGGYSSTLKYAADRIIPTISPLFEWVDGEMHHKLRYPPGHRFVAIGWQQVQDAESAAVFTQLAARNALNMHRFAIEDTVLCAGQSPTEQRIQIAQIVAKLEEN
ncbi:MAG: flavodoxin family protein [bacterium]